MMSTLDILCDFVSNDIDGGYSQECDFGRTTYNHGGVIGLDAIIYPHTRRGNTQHTKNQ